MTVRSIFCIRPRNHIREISFLRRLLLSLTDSLPKTLVSGYSYHRASIKRYYIITFYLKKLDLFYNSFHLIITSKIPNAILRTTDIRLIRSATQTPCKSRIILFPFRKKDSFQNITENESLFPLYFYIFIKLLLNKVIAVNTLISTAITFVSYTIKLVCSKSAQYMIYSRL